MKPIIIGAGLAGLSTALALAPMPVIVLSSGKLGEECSSAWAQGGIAAAVGEDDDPKFHAEDTIKVGGGLCDRTIVDLVTKDAARVIEKLLAVQTGFDRDSDGHLQLGLEAAHSHRRIVHAGGSTGKAIMMAVIKAVRATPSITLWEETAALELAQDDSGISGVYVQHNGAQEFIPTHAVVLATGGTGALWQYTTNPLSLTGQGLALAAKAGAVLGDLEFMQFHPTALDIGLDPMPLASEALRGEGATLIDEHGERFIDPLQARDVVARSIGQHSAKGHQIFLDLRKIHSDRLASRFATFYGLCRNAGFDPAHNPIPIKPAAHYHMGGVVTDARGRSNVKGLWACGEVANTGLNGANRLASNSLLEAASFGARVAEDIKGIQDSGDKIQDSKMLVARTLHSISTLRSIMTQHVGMVRDAVGLSKAIDILSPLAGTSDAALVALMVATAALKRKESRGAHARSDFPNPLPIAQRSTMTLHDINHTRSAA